MLFKQQLGLVAMGQSLTWAHPSGSLQPSAFVHHRDARGNSNAGGIVSLKSPVLEDRQVAEWCQVVQTVIQAVGSVPEEYRGYALATTSASLGMSGAAWGACQVVNGQNCGAISFTVASSVFTVGVGVSINLNLPIKGAVESEITEKRSSDSFAEHYADRLRALGMDFVSVEARTEPLEMQRDLAGTETARDGLMGIKIRGLRGNGDEHTTDHDIDLANGRATTRVHRPANDDGEGAGTKRQDNNGFKISYDLYHADSVFPVDEEGIRVLSDSLAADWADRADADHAMGEYFADLEFGGAYNMAIRITPNAGSSEDWEDPRMCGAA